MGHFSYTYNIEGAVRNIRAPSVKSTVASFLDTNIGTKGHIVMTEDAIATYYTLGPVSSAYTVDNGSIYIGTYAVDAYAQRAGTSPAQAAKDIAVHELGHVFFQQSDFGRNPGDSAPMSAKIDYCITREAYAVVFEYRAALEERALGSMLHVVGTSAIPDLFDTLSQAFANMNPASNQFELAAVPFVANLFKADRAYMSYCSNPLNWKKPAYMPEPLPASGTGVPSGGGGGGGLWYVPSDKSYWKEVPPDNPSDSLPWDPTTADSMAQIVGVQNMEPHHYALM